MPWGSRLRRTVADRFWEKVDKDGPIPLHAPELGQCWLWTGAKSPEGYGRFSYMLRSRVAHDIAYILDTGHEPPSETPCITHRCDGGDIGCVRPTHLLPDTHGGNMAGAAMRGRMPSGERHYAAKLSDADVAIIRTRYAQGGLTHATLAQEYGASTSAIGLIISMQRRRPRSQLGTP